MAHHAPLKTLQNLDHLHGTKVAYLQQPGHYRAYSSSLLCSLCVQICAVTAGGRVQSSLQYYTCNLSHKMGVLGVKAPVIPYSKVTGEPDLF